MTDEPLDYDGEIWKPVTDSRFNEPLEASSYGRVRRSGHRYLRNGRPGVAPFWSTKKPRIAKDYFRGEYPYVNVKWHGKTMGCPTHILICNAFHGDRPGDRHLVAHADNIPANITPGNLRWATYADNEDDKVRHGTRMQGVACHLAVLTDERVREARGIYATGSCSITDIASQFGISRAAMSKALRRDTWKHVT